MTTSTTENEETAQAPAAAPEKTEAPKKAHVAARKPHVAPSKGKSGKKTTLAKKATKGAKGSKAGNKATGARQGLASPAHQSDGCADRR